MDLDAQCWDVVGGGLTGRSMIFRGRRISLPWLSKILSGVWLYCRGFLSTVFLATCVGALILAIVNSTKSPKAAIVERQPIDQNQLIHFGGLTIRVTDVDRLSDPSLPLSVSDHWSLDLSFLLPEFGNGPLKDRSHDVPAANQSEWQKEISLSIYSDDGTPSSVSPDEELDDLPGDKKPLGGVKLRSAWRSGAFVLGNCIASTSAATSCGGILDLGSGLKMRYGSSHIFSKTADLRDRLDQLASFFGFSEEFLLVSYNSWTGRVSANEQPAFIK